jgi:restriction endonuclease S subunit
MKILKDLCSEIIHGKNPIADNSNLETYKIVKPRNIRNDSNEISTDDLDVLQSSKSETLEKIVLKNGDILVSLVGEEFKAAIFKEGTNCIAGDRTAILRCKKETLAENLLRALKSPKTKNIIESKFRGTAIKTITISDLENTEIDVPL